MILTEEQWALWGYPDIDAYIVDIDDDGNFILDIDPTDNDGNGIPDILESLVGGGDVEINPSHGVVVG